MRRLFLCLNRALCLKYTTYSVLKHKNTTIFCGVFIWRGRRDLNPRCSFPHYSLSRGAP